MKKRYTLAHAHDERTPMCRRYWRNLMQHGGGCRRSPSEPWALTSPARRAAPARSGLGGRVSLHAKCSNVRTHTHTHTHMHAQLHAITTKRRSPTRATKDHLLTTGATKDHLLTLGARRAVGLAFTQAVHDTRVLCAFLIELSIVHHACKHAQRHSGMYTQMHAGGEEPCPFASACPGG